MSTAELEPLYAYTNDREAVINRLHRIEGQVRGIEKMVEEDRYCVDVLDQIGAASSALESLALRLLEDHVRQCLAAAIASGTKEGRERSDELLAAVQRYARTH